MRTLTQQKKMTRNQQVQNRCLWLFRRYGTPKFISTRLPTFCCWGDSWRQMCCNNVPKRILPMWGFGNLLAYNRGKVVHLLWRLQGEKVYNLTQLRRNHKKHAKNRPCDDEISDIQTLPVSRNVTLCSQASSCCKQFWKKLRQKRLDTPKMKNICIIV